MLTKKVGRGPVCKRAPPSRHRFLFKCCLIFCKARFSSSEAVGRKFTVRSRQPVQGPAARCCVQHGIPLQLLFSYFLTNLCPTSFSWPRSVFFGTPTYFSGARTLPHWRTIQVGVTTNELRSWTAERMSAMRTFPHTILHIRAVRTVAPWTWICLGEGWIGWGGLASLISSVITFLWAYG